MRKAWMIAALVLLALSVSGCANADYSEGTPSSEETAMTEPVQSIAPQEHTTVSVSESTEIATENAAESEMVEIPPEVSTPTVDNAQLPTESGTTEPAPPKASEPPPAVPTDPPMQETEPSAAEEPAEPEFDIQTWIDYAKAYAESVGLRPESSAVDCWDTPIDADADCIYLERDICARLNRYAADETITDIWVWCEAVGTTAPYAPYELSNNNAEINRLKKRIESLERREETGFVGWQFEGGEAVANQEENRLQLLFDEKPGEEQRSKLKSWGFRWSPSNKAWQRQLNSNAIYAAGQIEFIKPLDGRTPRELQPKPKAKDEQER